MSSTSFELDWCDKVLAYITKPYPVRLKFVLGGSEPCPPWLKDVIRKAVEDRKKEIQDG